MNKNLGFAAIAACVPLAPAMGGTPALEWQRLLETRSNPGNQVVAFDGLAHVYLAGQTTVSLSGTNAGGSDVFLAKYDLAGNLVWIDQTGTTSGDTLKSLAVDASGNVYLSGHTPGSFDGPGTGSTDTFLIKYNNAGSILWSEQFGSLSYNTNESVAVDSAGNAYIAGGVDGPFDGPSTGDFDAYLAKYDASGSKVWERQFGTTSNDRAYSVDVDQFGNIYLTGSTNGSLGGTNEGFSDVFVAKYDSAGGEIWSKQLGTRSNESGYSIRVNDAGDIFITGGTSGDLGSPNSGIGFDAFTARLDSLGNVLWLDQWGTDFSDLAQGLAIDEAGNSYVTGYMYDGEGVSSNTNSRDLFILKYDSFGEIDWMKQVAGPSGDEGQSLTLDDLGNIYVGGSTAGFFGTTDILGSRAFVAKFSVPEPSSIAILALASPLLMRRRRA